MPAFTRERQGERTLLDICLCVHAHNSGASDPMPQSQLEEYVSILRDADLHWEEGPPATHQFDTAVRNLVDHTLAEHNRCERKRFEDHLKNASDTVSTWPEWKRKMLG